MRRPHTLRAAMTHAIQAEHAIEYTRRDVLPRIRQALAEVEGEGAGRRAPARKSLPVLQLAASR
jgi:hypothetical protein